jgi:hypothetical protein
MRVWTALGNLRRSENEKKRAARRRRAQTVTGNRDQLSKS